MFVPDESVVKSSTFIIYGDTCTWLLYMDLKLTIFSQETVQIYKIYRFLLPAQYGD